MAQTIIILGGGVGGLVLANKLRGALPREHRVILVDREASFTFPPSFLWVMTGDRSAEEISRPLALLEQKGIEVVRGQVERIDPENRQVTVSGQVLRGDYLIIALGAELDPETIPGLAEAGHNFFTLAGVERLRDAFAAFTGGKLVVLIATPAYKSLAAPCEAAMLLESLCRKRKIRERTQIVLYAAESIPVGLAGPKVSAAVLGMVLSKGIIYHVRHQIVEAEPRSRILRFSCGLEVSYDLLAYVPPHRAPDVVRQAGLADESGWIPVDSRTLETKYARVYALGDIVRIPLKCGEALPKAGVFAHRQAEVVAKNVVHAVTGNGKTGTFDGRGAFFVETGNGKAGFGNGNFYAEAAPRITLHPAARHWHAAKLLLEKEWFHRWF